MPCNLRHPVGLRHPVIISLDQGQKKKDKKTKRQKDKKTKRQKDTKLMVVTTILISTENLESKSVI